LSGRHKLKAKVLCCSRQRSHHAFVMVADVARQPIAKQSAFNGGCEVVADFDIFYVGSAN
jgi:hypothetical protein